MAELNSVSPTSRGLDVFGKDLSLTEAEQKVLGEVKDIFLAKKVQVESRTKKGDITEPRLLVLSSSRCYILLQNPVSKLETSFNFLKLQQLRCSEQKLSIQLLGENKLREFVVARQDSVEIVGLITAQIKNVFPITPLDLVMKLTFDPDSLSKDVTVLREDLMGGMDRVDAASLHGFLTSYAFLSDFFGVKYNTDISWYLKNVYLAHGLREIKLADFDQCTAKEILPMVSSLRHNSYFEGVVEVGGRVAMEVLEELWYVLRSSQALKTVVLADCGLKPDNVMRLSAAISNNPKAALTHLDLSDNVLEDKGLEGLCGALESLSHGLQTLKLANCKITAKGNSALASSLKKNKQMQYSLVHLDLSGNPLGPDPQGGLAFLQDPQTLDTLKLSRCGLVLDTVVPVLIRGCTQHLCELDLSHNPGRPKKAGGSSVGASLHKFCSNAIALRSIKLAGCKFTSSVVANLLEGLAANVNVTEVKLDVSCNELGGQGLQSLLDHLTTISCLTHLDLSDTTLDANMVDVITAITPNKKLRHLKLGKNFNGRAKAGAMQALGQLLLMEDCQLLSLGLEESHLKELMAVVLNALADNTSLVSININGNNMGPRGAALLAKSLLCNCRLSKVEWDHNDTPLRGFQEVSAAMKHNYTLRVMPLPLYDIGRAGKGVEEHVQLMQQYLCRNHSDERLKVEMAARHRNRLLTATQQSSVVGRELVQLEDLLHWAEGTDPSNELVKEGVAVKELATSTIKLTDGLYSPQVESEQFQSISEQVKQLVDDFMDQVFVEHIEAKSEKMILKSKQLCGSGLPEETCDQLDDLVIHNKTREFSQSKRDVLRHALPEIVNHVSDTNVEVAAGISELLVDYTLSRLDRINSRLLKLQSDQRPTRRGTDIKVSRNFTFRAQEDAAAPTGGKRKKRMRRADPDDDDEDAVDIPGVPLTTEGPSLQHLGKTRPKPARMQRNRPSKRPAVQPDREDPFEDKVTTTETPPPIHSSKPPSSPLIPPPASRSRTSIKLPPPPKDKPPKEAEDIKEGSEIAVSTMEEDSAGTSTQDKIMEEKDTVSAGVEVAAETESEETGQSKSPSQDELTSSEDEEHRTVEQGPMEVSLLDQINSKMEEKKKEEDSQETKMESDKPREPNRDSKKSSIKEKRSNLSKVLFQSKPADDSVGGATSKSADDSVGGSEESETTARSKENSKENNVISNEWEVLDGPEVAAHRSPSPEIIKKPPPVIKEKPPPVIKEKPRKTAEPAKEKSSGDGEAKKTPILPSEHLTSRASMPQKGPVKPAKNPSSEGKGGEGSGKGKTSPTPPSKPRATEEPSKHQDSPQMQPASNGPTPKTPELKDKSSPAPAPKPKPKPGRGKESSTTPTTDKS